MFSMRSLFVTFLAGTSLAAFSQKPRMTSVIPDSVKKMTEKFMLQFISKKRMDSSVVFDAKESWGAGYRSQGKKDTSWSYEVRYRFFLPGKEKAYYSFYFNIVEGKIINNKDPFPSCVTKDGPLSIIGTEKAKEILFKSNPNFKANWEKVTTRLGMGDCFTWVFTYKDEPPKSGTNVPSSSLVHTVTINASTGEIITPKSGNN